MGAIVKAGQSFPAKRVVSLYPTSSVNQLSKKAAGSSRTTHRVDDQIDFHAQSGSVRESRNKPASQLALLKDIGLKIDAFLGSLNGIKFASVKGIPVGKNFNTFRAV